MKNFPSSRAYSWKFVRNRIGQCGSQVRGGSRYY